MCNLYSMTRNREAILRFFRISDNRAPVIDPQPSIFPACNAPVIRKAPDGERELSIMGWGFVLLQEGKAPKRITNVRDDKILTSRFWTPSFQQRRCLVPLQAPANRTERSQQIGFGSQSTVSTIVSCSPSQASGSAGRDR
jgi:putative SOS response-associated peptidase YedK